MEITAVSKSVRISPRKVRLVAGSIRSLTLEKALIALELTPKRGASVLLDTLKSAVGNAVNNAKSQRANLFIKKIDIFDGPGLKRFHASTRGRVHPYKKRSSHIKIILETKGEEN